MGVLAGPSSCTGSGGSRWTGWRSCQSNPTAPAPRSRSSEAIGPARTTPRSTSSSPVAAQILAVGSIKWLESSPFDSHDSSALILHRAKMPGADKQTPLLVLTRSGCTVEGVTPYGPEELIEGRHS